MFHIDMSNYCMIFIPDDNKGLDFFTNNVYGILEYCVVCGSTGYKNVKTY